MTPASVKKTEASPMRAITPFLWLDGCAAEAVDFYCSIFPDSEITRIIHKPDEPAAGSVLTIKFKLKGEEFIAFNASSPFRFSEALSMMILCDTQEEIDYYWEKLAEGGTPLAAGWLKDRYGLSWQVTPAEFFHLMDSEDVEHNARLMAAMNTMVKFDLETLRAASRGEWQPDAN
ncbi:MAG: VOC family protein [Synechococcus sp. SB0668_bin_15]|nr:VOC family protein [Synechococcus sp. SB0668_bin_15]MXZ83372.1 VOC family protein [Synechococcus sp. SB0666_bin_14]MYC50076.1 VOC family protein [Synechococcus sp. SB0662_bin_14]MYG47213.1 VOC family protein [Synechococcus sp. SB0675_bin_6]MYJ60406.1 VOC family protein [Synechococcus sp. SB0672_bin_6]MYK91413.1 VOC family protein [Synechococcus sp. SB0669_bin_8]